MSETHVIAGYFMWREANDTWQRDMRRFPYLGTVDERGNHVGYDQDHPWNVEKHLAWGQAHGVRVFAPIWRGRYDGGWDDPRALDIDVLRRVIDGRRFHNMRWCLFLGNVVPGNQPPLDVDFGPRGEPTAAYDNFVDSLTTGLAARGWLDDRRYFTVDGKPVVFVFRSKDFVGDYAGAVERVRRFHDGKIFLVGMSGHWHRHFADLPDEDVARILPFDAVTAWSATAGTPPEPGDLAAVADWLRPRLVSWRDGVAALERDGDGPRIGFVPTVTCQYDKSKIMGSERTRRWARSRDDFHALVEVARECLDPRGIGESGDRMVWVQTFNEWPESTACEPTELGPSYPAVHPAYQDAYGFDFLEVLRDLFHPHLQRTPREALLVTPADGAVVHTTQPELAWDEVRANPPVEAYRLRIERARDGTLVVEEDLPPDQRTFVPPFGTLAPRSEYTWQVRVRNGWRLGWGEWSLRRRFEVR